MTCEVWGSTDIWRSWCGGVAGVDGCAEIEPVPAFNFFNFSKKKFQSKIE
jgi:hypothetical protein